MALLALSLSGCGASEQPLQQGAGCEGRGESIQIGMSRPSATGELRVALESAAPLPPETGDNSWKVRLLSEAGEPVRGAVVVSTSVMVDHDHPAPSQLAVETEPGLYEITPIVLTMPGFWTLTLGVTPESGAADEIAFDLCVER